jgi:hypothetical protein
MLNHTKTRHFSLSVLVITLLTPLISFASFEGMWRTEHPDLGGVFFRIKSDESCSYFLEAGTQTQINLGECVQEGDMVRLSFENGVVIEVMDSTNVSSEARIDSAGVGGSSMGFFDTTAVRVSNNAIGRLTVDEDDEDEEEDRSGFFGGWEGDMLDGEKFYLYINNDRTAGISRRLSDDNIFKGTIGYWNKEGEKLLCYWNDGSFSFIELNGRRVEMTWFDEGSLLEEAKGYTYRILPVATRALPTDWYTEFRNNYSERMPIIVLRNLSQMKSFFRGSWQVGDGGEDGDQIKLRRFGNAWTNRYGGVKGDWYPRSDRATIVWQNGVKETISTVANQFVVMSYNPNQPLSGRPARIQRVEPEKEEKLGYYVNRKRELLDPQRILQAGRR